MALSCSWKQRGEVVWRGRKNMRSGPACWVQCRPCSVLAVCLWACPVPAAWRWWQHYRHGTGWRFRGSCMYSTGLSPRKVLDVYNWIEVSPCQIHAAEEYVIVVPQPQTCRDMPVCSANSERGSLYVICINDLEISFWLCFPLVHHLADCCILWDFSHSLK